MGILLSRRCPTSPGSQSSGAGRSSKRKVSDARASQRCRSNPGAGGSSDATTGRPGRRAFATRRLEPSSRRRRGYRTGLSTSGTSSSAATEKPRRVRGEGEARRLPPPGCSSSSSPRPVKLTPAPAPRARPPLTPPLPAAATEPPRPRGVG